uniref:SPOROCYTELESS-like EAR-containing protein 3 n=1 Tax=Leersia perrieri TaxID=77586 RepID=A0A0D9WJM2_9ORYZ
MEWPGRGRSFRSRKGKRSAGSSSDKPKQPQRGLGVAQLEKIRIQSEMAAGYLQNPSLGQQPPPVHGIGSLNLEDARSSNSLSSSPSPSFRANINASSPYPIHPNIARRTGVSLQLKRFYSPMHVNMAYGLGSRSGDIRYGEFQSASPIIRHYGLNQPADSINSDDPEDVDLELKL